jgi:hypothetical protein
MTARERIAAKRLAQLGSRVIDRGRCPLLDAVRALLWHVQTQLDFASDQSPNTREEKVCPT